MATTRILEIVSDKYNVLGISSKGN